jgi:hypothetical protein
LGLHGGGGVGVASCLSELCMAEGTLMVATPVGEVRL